MDLPSYVVLAFIPKYCTSIINTSVFLSCARRLRSTNLLSRINLIDLIGLDMIPLG